MKLLNAIEFFKPGESTMFINDDDGIIIPLKFEQDYGKEIKIYEAFQKDSEFYNEEIVKILVKELIKNKGVKIEVTQGRKKDTIKASFKYVLEF